MNLNNCSDSVLNQLLVKPAAEHLLAAFFALYLNFGLIRNACNIFIF